MTRIKMSDAQKIEAVADRNEWGFAADYSGRCMFGHRCVGIICPPAEVGAVKAAVKRAGIKAEPSRDSMGRDAIVYWSSIRSEETPES